MIKYEDIKHLKMSLLSEDDFKIWIMDEITDLANDFGQKIDNEMLIHSVRRMKEVLYNGKYRSWAAGDVHAAFQMGLNGAFGIYHKVTVKALLNFLNSAQKLMISKTVEKAEEESDRRAASFNPKITWVSDFIIWATTNNICLEYLSPGYDALAAKRVSPAIEKMADDYHEAVDMGILHVFSNRLRNDSLSYAEKIKENGKK